MKLPFTLLAASLLATSVSANSYTLCCCTKLIDPRDSQDPRVLEDPSRRYGSKFIRECNRAATQTIIDAMYSHFEFTTHYWVGEKETPKFPGRDYIYATRINGNDNHIGQKEMAGWYSKQRADRYCWTPGSKFSKNYKGESQNDGGIP